MEKVWLHPVRLTVAHVRFETMRYLTRLFWISDSGQRDRTGRTQNSPVLWTVQYPFYNIPFYPQCTIYSIAFDKSSCPKGEIEII